MINLKKLSRDEMKNVKGGVFGGPNCQGGQVLAFCLLNQVGGSCDIIYMCVSTPMPTYCSVTRPTACNGD